MGALAAPEERQDAYALLMAAATELGWPTGGWQPGPPAPPTPPSPTPPPAGVGVVEFVAPAVDVLAPALVVVAPALVVVAPALVDVAPALVAPDVVVAPRIPAQDATLAQGTTVAVAPQILVQDTTVAVAPHTSAQDTTIDRVVAAPHMPAAQDSTIAQVQVVVVVASASPHLWLVAALVH